MGCLGIALASLLALAIPVSIAHTSLVGAYVVIALLAAVGVAAVVLRARRRSPRGAGPVAEAAEAVPGASRTPGALAWIGVLTVVYAVVVTIVNRTG